MICDATLIPLGSWNAVGPPELDEELPCECPAPSALPEVPTQEPGRAGRRRGQYGERAEPDPSGEGAPAVGACVLLLSVVLVGGLGASFWLRLRPKTRP